MHESWLPLAHPMHRPRHSPRQRTALICAIAFFLAPVLAFVLGVRPTEIDNRPLQRFPTPAQGWRVFTGLPTWAADHLPFRGAAVRAQNAISRGVFGEPPPVRGDQQPRTPLGPIAGQPSVSGRFDIDVSAIPPVIEGSDGWLYLGEDVRFKCAPTRSLDESIEALRQLRSAVLASGRRFALVIAPDKTTMAPQHLPDRYLGKDCANEATAEFWRRVPAETDAIDLRAPLRDVIDSGRSTVYDALDTHWTYEGGVVMTYALANELAPSITSAWRLTPSKAVTWPADIPILLGRDQHRVLQAYELAPDGLTNRSNFDPSDFRQPKRYTSPPIAGAINRPIGMVADSFTQFASPYLAAVCSDITIVHPDTVAGDLQRSAAMLAEKEIIVFEIAERRLAGGTSPLLLRQVVDEISRAVAARPLR